MEVVAVSHACPREYDIGGLKLSTSIVHEPLTSSADYIDIDQTGVVNNRTAIHSGPVYVFLAENYDYWCSELGIDRASWGWCHWGENITLRSAGTARLETEIRLGELWSIGASVRLEVCGSRIPCRKVSWRCGQKDQWLQPLAESGRVGLYLRVVQGGRVHPGDKASLVSTSEDAVDVATITRCAFDSSLKTTHTLDLLANHATLLGMNKQFMLAKKSSIEDKLAEGKHAWKGWRSLRVSRRVDEGGGVVSFFLRPVPGQGEWPLACYRPGQFLSIKLPSGQVRSWTISDFPSRDIPSYYRISVKKAVGASAWMHEHGTVGTELSARSPAGRFVLDWSPPLALRQVYVSAGIGITPVVAMLKAHACHPKFAHSPAVCKQHPVFFIASPSTNLSYGTLAVLRFWRFSLRAPRNMFLEYLL